MDQFIQNLPANVTGIILGIFLLVTFILIVFMPIILFLNYRANARQAKLLKEIREQVYSIQTSIGKFSLE